MAEYISKEYIINKCKEHRELYISAWGNFNAMPKEDKATCDAYATCCSDVVNAPASDVQPVRRGEWENERYDELLHCYSAICSECGFESTDHYCISRTHKYCEYCGARMDGDTNG